MVRAIESDLRTYTMTNATDLKSTEACDGIFLGLTKENTCVLLEQYLLYNKSIFLLPRNICTSNVQMCAIQSNLYSWFSVFVENVFLLYDSVLPCTNYVQYIHIIDHLFLSLSLSFYIYIYMDT